MDWIKTIQTLLTLKDIYDNGAEVKKLHDYAKKQKPGKLEWDTVKYFGNAKLDKRNAELKAYESKLDKALKEKIEMPESGTVPLFAKWLQTASKKGEGSPEARKAAADYAKGLQAYDKRMKEMLKSLKAAHSELPKKISFTATMADYAKAVSDLFIKFAQTPNPLIPGTAWQAEMFVLSQDTQRYSGSMRSINTRLKKLQTKNKDAISELEFLIKNNADWIKAAQDKAFGNPDTLKKNEKATKPKK